MTTRQILDAGIGSEMSSSHWRTHRGGESANGSIDASASGLVGGEGRWCGSPVFSRRIRVIHVIRRCANNVATGWANGWGGVSWRIRVVHVVRRSTNNVATGWANGRSSVSWRIRVVHVIWRGTNNVATGWANGRSGISWRIRVVHIVWGCSSQGPEHELRSG